MRAFLRTAIGLAAAALLSAAVLAFAQTPPTNGFSADTLACLKAAVGADRFEAISSGQSQPTADEVAKGQHCFQSQPAPAVPPLPTNLPPVVKECVIQVFGAQASVDILAGNHVPTLAEEQQVRDCVAQKYQAVVAENQQLKAELQARQQGDETVGPEPPRPVNLPDALKTCLIKAVGQARFDAVMNGEHPTKTDEQKGQPCFKQYQKDHPEDRQFKPPMGPAEMLKNLPADKVTCIQQALGADRFKAVFQDLNSFPTPDEKQQIGEQCFNAEHNQEPGQGPDETMPPEDIDQGNGSPGEAHPGFMVPPDVQACLKAALGADQFNALMNGTKPTEDEMAKGKSCFQSHSMMPPRPPQDEQDMNQQDANEADNGDTNAPQDESQDDQGSLDRQDQAAPSDLKPPAPPTPPPASWRGGPPQPFSQPPVRRGLLEPPAPPTMPNPSRSSGQAAPQNSGAMSASDACITKIVGPATLQQLKASNYDFTAAGVSEDQSQQIISRCFSGRE